LAVEAVVSVEAAAEIGCGWVRVDALINNAAWLPSRSPILRERVMHQPRACAHLEQSIAGHFPHLRPAQ